MARGYQRIIISGMVATEPEIRSTNNGVRIASFTIPTTEVWNDKGTGQQKEEVEWHRCVAIGPKADLIEKHVHKRSMLTIEGQNRTREWQDQNGNKRQSTEVKVMGLTFMDGPRDGSQANPVSSNAPAQTTTQNGVRFDDSGDIPF